MLVYIAGCQDKDYLVKVRFNQTAGLEQGNPVFANGRAIGQVTAIEKKENEKSTVTLNIDEERENQITEYAIFTIGEFQGAERFGAPIRAYVTEAEITQSQKNINNIQNLSELG